MKINEEKTAESPEGRYANYFKIGHNDSEVVVDFGQYFPEAENLSIHTRIVINPANAKALSRLFAETVAQYESSFGEIKR